MLSEAEGVDSFKIKGTMIKVTMTMMPLIGYVRIVCNVYRQFSAVSYLKFTWMLILLQPLKLNIRCSACWLTCILLLLDT